MLKEPETIVAMASPPGRGAIAVIRVSGKRSFSITEALLENNEKGLRLEKEKRVLGNIVRKEESGAEERVDQVVVHCYQAPHSYTGEDVVEINCHGNPLLVREVIELLTAQGARLAQPGEFTRRAYLNGKMDLLQAEAVIDLINAETINARRSSFAQLEGGLSEAIGEIKEGIKTICASLEMELDFFEEGMEVDYAGLLAALLITSQEIEKLLASFKLGKVVREGVHLVIIGRPNVGKSSLLNRLLQEERVIVSDLPGTTRDAVEAHINIGGALFRITDTAGIRRGGDAIEAEGVKKTLQIMQRADIFLLLLDNSEPLQPEDLEIFALLKDYPEKRVMMALNKIDLPVRLERERVPVIGARDFLQLCSKTGEGLHELEGALLHYYNLEGEQGALITSSRHQQALNKALGGVKGALGSLREKRSPEFVVFDLRRSLEHLGEISGEVTSEEILQTIFSSFCVGK
jgi:tRNA modification GTPase